MEANIQDILSSLTRQISDLSVKLAVAEATIANYQSRENPDSTDDGE
jgi:hypothetical protein